MRRESISFDRWLRKPAFTPVFCLLLGVAAILPLALGRHTVLIQDMLVAYYCYFADFHRDASLTHLPLWSSSYQTGMPMYAYWQSGWLYPIAWLCFGPLSPQNGLYVFYALHFGVAAYGFTVLGPSLRLGRAPSLWAGVVFALSGTLLARYEHPTFMAGWAYMPWVLGLFLRARERPTASRLSAYAVVFALQAYGGHPQATFTQGLLLLPFTLWPWARLLPGMKAHALALCLALPLFLPFLQLVSETGRYGGMTWEKGGLQSDGPSPAESPRPDTNPSHLRDTSEVSAFGFTEFAAGALRPPHLLALVYPYALGTPAHATWWGHEPWTEVYVGLGGLGLLMLFFARRRGLSPRLLVLGGLGLAGLWLALGPLLFASHLTFHLPGFGQMRRPGRYDILFILALAAFSGHGLRGFLARPARARRHRLPLQNLFPAAVAVHALGAVTLLFLGLSAWPWAQISTHAHGKDYAPKLMALCRDLSHDFLWMTLALFLCAWLWRRSDRRAFLPLLFLLLGAGSLRLHWVHFHPFPSDYYTRPPATLGALDLNDKPFWRLTHYLEYPGDSLWFMHHQPLRHLDLYDREKAALSYGIHAVFGLRHASAHLPLLWRWGRATPPTDLSARYLLTDQSLTAFHGQALETLGRYGSVSVYEMPGYAPRLERKPRRDGAGAHARASVPVDSPSCPEDFARHADLCAREPRDGQLELRGPFQAGDTLLFREHYWPGWQMRSGDGRWQPLLRDSIGFQYAVMDQSNSKIEMRFFPDAFFRLCGVCAAAFAALLWLWGRRAWIQNL